MTDCNANACAKTLVGDHHIVDKNNNTDNAILHNDTDNTMSVIQVQIDTVNSQSGNNVSITNITISEDTTDKISDNQIAVNRIESIETNYDRLNSDGDETIDNIKTSNENQNAKGNETLSDKITSERASFTTKRALTTESTTTKAPCLKVSDSVQKFCARFSSLNIQHQRCIGICS